MSNNAGIGFKAQVTEDLEIEMFVQAPAWARWGCFLKNT